MRGSNDFTVMKGFMEDYTVKGDVTDKAEVDEVKGSKAKTEKKEKPDKDATHMSEDVSYVGDAADKDIADSYVSDVQGDKVSKGWETYNKTCASGVVLKDYGFDKNNVGSVIKAMEDGIVTKEILTEAGARRYEENFKTEQAAKKQAQQAARAANHNRSGGSSETVPPQPDIKPVNRTASRSGADMTMPDEVSKVSEAKNKIKNATDTAKDYITSNAKKAGAYIKANPIKSGLGAAGGIAALGAGAYGLSKLRKSNDSVDKGYDFDDIEG